MEDADSTGSASGVAGIRSPSPDEGEVSTFHPAGSVIGIDSQRQEGRVTSPTDAVSAARVAFRARRGVGRARAVEQIGYPARRLTPGDRARLADEELIESVASGDDRAFEVLYDRHGRAAWSLAFRLLRDRETAEDVMQEAFVAMWNGADRYMPASGSARTWLLSIVHHRAVDRLRQTAAHGRRQQALEQEAGRVAADDPDVADVALAHVTATHVKSALSDVPDDQSQVLRLAYYGGFTQVEIAGMLSLPLGTVKSRIRLGLEQVRRNIELDTAPA